MNFFEENEETINNEYDYSNILPSAENIGFLVQYCEQVYNQFTKLVDDDEQRNEKLKYEFQDYKYKKCYGEQLEIIIKSKNYNNITCKNYSSYIETVKNGQVNNLNGLEINLDLDYKRGKKDSLKNYDNSFKIIFKPYEINFIRKSNHNESDMNNIEKNINEILNKFPKYNTIFYTK